MSDPLSRLGEPFASYAAALVAADAAQQREHAARIAGDRRAVAAAELDREDAIIRVYTAKHTAACWLLFAARAAAELFPGALQAHLDPVLDPVFRRELDATQQAVIEIERALAAREGAA